MVCFKGDFAQSIWLVAPKKKKFTFLNIFPQWYGPKHLSLFIYTPQHSYNHNRSMRYCSLSFILYMLEYTAKISPLPSTKAARGEWATCSAKRRPHTTKEARWSCSVPPSRCRGAQKSKSSFKNPLLRRGSSLSMPVARQVPQWSMVSAITAVKPVMIFFLIHNFITISRALTENKRLFFCYVSWEWDHWTGHLILLHFPFIYFFKNAFNIYPAIFAVGLRGLEARGQ